MQPAHKTLEGQIVAVISAISAVAAGLNPHQFPPAISGAIITISLIALIVQRTLIQFQVQKGATALGVAHIAAGNTAFGESATPTGVLSVSAPAPAQTVRQEAEDYALGAGLVVQYDSTSPLGVPGFAQAVAGYCDLNFAHDWIGMVKRFPRLAALHRVVSIAASTSTVARIIDIESGNPATPAEGASWVKRMIHRGIYRPGIYANRASMPAIKAALEAVGLRREQYVLWVADWGPEAIPAGYDACQFFGSISGAKPDITLCHADFFPRVGPAPKPKPKPKDASPHGVAKSVVGFDLKTLQWDVHREVQTDLTLEDEGSGKDAAALLKINTHTGRWTVEPLPWGFKP